MPQPPFDIVPVTVPGEGRRDEQLGTKPKFWFKAADGHSWLFKQGRVNEDWSEKAAAECAAMLGLPHASVDLAVCEQRPGITSPSFLSHGEELVHGNEILLGFDDTYPQNLQFYHVAQHTLDGVLNALAALNAGPPLADGLPSDFDGRDVFVGYLLLDAWIGNTDRHHQNWAVIRRQGGEHVLSPTYDHGSSLGRNETPERANNRLDGQDPRVTVMAYAVKARSALYLSRDDSRPMTTIEAFRSAAALRPRAAQFWLDRLRRVENSQIVELFDRFPIGRPPPPFGRFAIAILACNRERLLQDLP